MSDFRLGRSGIGNVPPTRVRRCCLGPPAVYHGHTGAIAQGPYQTLLELIGNPLLKKHILKKHTGTTDKHTFAEISSGSHNGNHCRAGSIDQDS